MTAPRPASGDAVRATQAWFTARTFGAKDLPDRDQVLAAKRSTSVAVVIPARDEARTIGAICERISRDLVGTLVDELVVMDCASTDRTAQLAEAAGARVIGLPGVLPEIPWVLGKGEALWRSLAVVDADVICFVDGDIRNFDSRFVERLIAPLLTDPSLSFTKGFYRRPLRLDATLVPAAGGRVTELTARPLLNLCYPELAGFLQPLAGEYAGRSEALRAVPFLTGYGVDVALLIDLARTTGISSMAQVDLEERVHRNRPLRELRSMATVVARAILRRAERDGRLTLGAKADLPVLLPGSGASIEAVDLVQAERPPMDEVLADLRRLAFEG